jgi:hypothetical protein
MNCFLATFLLYQLTWASPLSVKENFDALKIHSTPIEWDFGAASDPSIPHWEVVADNADSKSGKILKKTGSGVYSWFVNRSISTKNGTVESKVRIESGNEDPEAGVIWRFLDPKNYYYVRLNSLEGNLVFYRMVRGQKELIQSVDIATPKQKWHRLKVTFLNQDVTVYFNEKKMISTRDSKLMSAGRMGFFTTADTISSFDDFVATED